MKIMNRLRNLKLSRKLLLLFVVVSVMPILGIQIYNYISTGRQVTQQVDRVIQENLVQIAERTNLTLEMYTNLLYQIYVDDQAAEEVGILLSGTQTRKAAARSSLRARLRQYTSVVEGIRCISLVCTNGENVTYDYLRDSAVRNLWARFPDMRMSPPYMDAKNRPGMVITPTMEFLDDGTYRYYFHISKRLFDFDHLEKGSIATIILTVDERVLNEIGNAQSGEAGSGIYYILSGEDGKLISFPDQSKTTRTVADREEELLREWGLPGSGRIRINRYVDPATGWVFCNAYDVETALSDLREPQRMIILMSVLVLAVAAGIVWVTIRRLNRSVRDVVQGMHRVEQGDLTVRIRTGSEDEIGEIARNFNHMTGRVSELIDEVGQAKDRQREAEIKALEAQINPHFLYNTLDSINWMAIDHGEKEISLALRNLGLLLRYSISNSDQLTTVRAEMDMLERYLQLQDIRYEGAFTWSVKAQEETLGLKIHKLLIQPFAENAVVHGMADMESGGEIRVETDLSEDGQYLRISIADNGCGMGKETRESLTRRDLIFADSPAGPGTGSGLGLGVYNVFRRLVMYYGEDAHWNVNSVEGVGTEVVLYIPVSATRREK